MTHYTVLVRVDGTVDYDDIDSAVTATLAPYDENIEVAPYRHYEKTSTLASKIRTTTSEYVGSERTYEPTLDLRDEGLERPVSPSAHREDYQLPNDGWDTERWKRDWDEYERLDAVYNEALVQRYTWAEIADAYNRYWDYQDENDKLHVDEKGVYSISTYNPNSRWDWWQIGGRWRGFFTAKNQGEYPLTPGNPGTGEGWDALDRESGESFFTHQDKVRDQVAANTADMILRGQTDIVRVEHLDWAGAQANFAAEMGDHYDECVPDDRELGWDDRRRPSTISREDYIADKVSSYVGWHQTAAICDPDLGWVQNGRTGWFGTMGIDATMSEDEWTAKWQEYVEGLDPRDWLVVVDCHI